MTRIYLAWNQKGHETLARHADEGPVDVLIAYPFLHQFSRLRKHYNLGSVALDSGAFSAWNSGTKIDLADYTAAAKDFQCDEVFGLDVVWNPEATQRNLEAMWEAGVDAIPCFHGGSPWRWLDWAAQRPKIAVSSRLPKKREWLLQVFARVHPKRVHGFALAGRTMLSTVPFDSVDACSWEFGPAARGSWAGYRGDRPLRLAARGIDDFWVEVENVRRRQRWAAARWGTALQRIRQTGTPCT
jgi:hypothetical protein